MDPILIYVVVVVLVIGPLFAAGYIWLNRRISRLSGTSNVRLTAVGNVVVVAFVVVLGTALILRQFYPETALGSWLRIENNMPMLVAGCFALLFGIEALLKRLGVRTAKDSLERDV